jgi:hypothetical protein
VVLVSCCTDNAGKPLFSTLLSLLHNGMPVLGMIDQPVTIDSMHQHTCAAAGSSAGKPLFGTLISLLHNGVPVLGVIDQPVTRERWVGLAGQQSSLNGRPISVRGCGDISNAYMYSTTPHMFAGQTEQVRQGWPESCQQWLQAELDACSSSMLCKQRQPCTDIPIAYAGGGNRARCLQLQGPVLERMCVGSAWWNCSLAQSHRTCTDDQLRDTLFPTLAVYHLSLLQAFHRVRNAAQRC